jgi:mono/diheme cytochrome c family protein
MNRSHLNLIIDLLAAACLAVMLATGYILRFPLPPTTNRTHELWGLSRHEWGAVHSWASLALLAVLLVHLVLHWEWIFATVRHRFTSTKAAPNQRRNAGIITLAVFVILGGVFGWVTQSGVRELPVPLHPLSEPDVALPETVNFKRDVMPIFEASCIGCHGAKKQRGKFRVDRREDFFALGDPKPLIVPGDSEKSRLITIVSGGVKNMKAAEDHVLPAAGIAVLKTWIDAGAEWPPEPAR